MPLFICFGVNPTCQEAVTRIQSKVKTAGTEQNRQYDPIIRKASEKYKVDPHLIKAIIHVESSFRHDISSGDGAVGLMQITPGTGRFLQLKDPRNPFENIFAGSKYLRYLLSRFNEDETLAVAAYNAGPTAVEKYAGIPPYKETQRYVERVMLARMNYVVTGIFG